ncbi:MAG: VWA domain-containing protein [Planctomycetes bacterium]|nr:VWA domain-containing protein [Planctomycetota bacterium]
MRNCSKNTTHRVNPQSLFCPECRAPVEEGGSQPTQPLPPTMVPQSVPYSPPFRLVIDKTGSMEKINLAVANTIGLALDEGAKLGVNLTPGVIFVRDLKEHGSKGLVDMGYLDISAAKQAIANEPCIGNSTHDESQLDAIKAAIEGPWPGLKPGKARCIVLTTNSGTHDPTEDGTTSDGVVVLAQKTGARIFIIGPGKDPIYKKLCDGTGGILWDVDRMTAEMYVSVMKMLGKTITQLAVAG